MWSLVVIIAVSPSLIPLVLHVLYHDIVSLLPLFSPLRLLLYLWWQCYTPLLFLPLITFSRTSYHIYHSITSLHSLLPLPLSLLLTHLFLSPLSQCYSPLLFFLICHNVYSSAFPSLAIDFPSSSSVPSQHALFPYAFTPRCVFVRLGFPALQLFICF